jgi:hypothetical protein
MNISTSGDLPGLHTGPPAEKRGGWGTLNWNCADNEWAGTVVHSKSWTGLRASLSHS